MWKILCFLGVVACQSPGPVEPAFEGVVDVSQDPHFIMAEEFDAWLAAPVRRRQKSALPNQCEENPGYSVFCPSVTGFEDFEQALRKREQTERARSGVAVQPRFNKRNKLLNWREVRSSSPTALVRRLPSKNRVEMDALKTAALTEMECPNTAAVAIAAVLESRLPKQVMLEEIGRLYEKGGACMQGDPEGQAQVLTRAGLFYVGARKYDLASQVLTGVAGLPGVFKGRALYWIHRIGEMHQGSPHHSSSGKKALEELEARYPFSFHSLMAQTAAGRDPGRLLTKRPTKTIRRSSQDARVNGLLEQVEILSRFGFSSSSARVLDWAVAVAQGIEPEVMLYLAELKLEHHDYKGKIAILSDVLHHNPSLVSGHTLQLYFPKVLFPLFEAQAAGLDPYFLLAVARRESAFDPTAVSSANARGLMQVLPATARQIKKRPDLFDPQTNVAIGAKYLVELLKRTDGQVHWALAAYNAGPAKLKSWTKIYPTDDPVLFIDLMPLRETREYVGSVLRNYYWYRRIHEGAAELFPERVWEIGVKPPDLTDS